MLGPALLGTGLLLGATLPPPDSGCWGPPPESPAARALALQPRSLLAARIPGTPPEIDGRLDEPVWCLAPVATDFVQSRPAPGALATLPSLVRVLFDGEAVYVAVRLEDPHPDSLVAPFPRRDDEVTSDWVFVEIDTRFDRRSGFSFGLNPRGVQVDGTWANDVDYDPAWNGVWQGAAGAYPGGWTAEFRIPFSELALSHAVAGTPLTWGLNVYRNTPHRGETSNWSPRLPTVVGVVSRFNLLRGIAAPPHGGSMQLIPYGTITRSGGLRRPGEPMHASAGGDLRVRPSPSSSVQLSMHPDFGQVEADPSQVNLTTFETFLPEQRPLFLEGADLFQFSASLPFASRGVSFAQESPFYSRRIGRAPELGLPAGLAAVEVPASTTVLGAVRATARTADGWSGGVFHAWTDGEAGSGVDTAGRHRTTQLEPLTSYGLLRATRESSDGDAAAGVMATLVNRVGMVPRVDSQLPRRALVAGSEARWRHGAWELTGFALGSSVEGSPAAVTRLRSELRHGYGRPRGTTGGGVRDSTSRSLTGLAAQARLARLEGPLQWSLAGRVVTRGFEANDAGFQRNANWLLLAGDWRYQVYHPGHGLRRWSIGSDQLGIGWTMAGERRAAVADVRVSGDLRNYWGAAVSLGHEFPAADPEVLRGGPALLLPARNRWSAQLYSDTRRSTQLVLDLRGETEAATDSHRLELSPTVSSFVSDRLQLGLAPRVAWAREGWQYVGEALRVVKDTAATRRYLLGRLVQREVSLTARATYAFSPHLTLQSYLQAFLSSGQYHGFAEVRSPRARAMSRRVAGIARGRVTYDSAGGRYLVDGGTDSAGVFSDPAFADRSLDLNLVLRWEFLPGSTLFLVWTQERNDREPGPFRLRRDLARLAHADPLNTLQLKVSYWLTL